MPLVVLDKVAANPANVFYVAPKSANACEVYLDSSRQLDIAQGAEQVAAQLGGLRRLRAASTQFAEVWINPSRVAAVAPHPQEANSSFVLGATRQVPVQGDVATVIALLS
jgi:hypothetical protein